MMRLSIPLDLVVAKLDRFQRAHPRAGFLVALVKKYSEDEAGYKAALLTYYGFLSLFPLLLVLTSLLKLFLRSNPEVSGHIISGITAYVPVIGGELQQNIHGLGTTGVALVFGIIVTLYGARGVADVMRGSLDQIWEVPHVDRFRFPHGLLRSMGVIVIGGLGLVLTPLIAGSALAFGRGVFFQAVSVLVAAFLLFWVIVCVVKLGSSCDRPLRTIWVGSTAATVGLELLQLLGSLIVARELRHLDNLYGAFALILGLFYWIYLQAQVLMYGLEIDALRTLKLWPRSLQPPLTEGDRAAYRLYAARSHFPEE